MRLFFKHLLRDVSRFPLQIVLIILTLSVSACVGVGAFKTQRIFVERAYWIADTENELGDIVLTPGASDMRMIFDSDVDSLLGEGDRMFGEFRISAFTKDNAGNDFIVSVSGADLTVADSFFEFVYTDYGSFTEENLSSSAVISQSAAEETGKAVGDTFTLTFLGNELTYTVQAIAENGTLFKECDVLIPISSLQRVLSCHVPSITLLGEAFTPYTRMLIKLGDIGDADAMMQKIRQSENLQHCGATLRTTESTVTDMRILAQTGSVFLISSVLIILCVLLCLTCLRLLGGKRRQDYALFSVCGASERQINAMRLCETLFYSLIGAAIGIPLSKYIVDWVCSLILLPDKEYTVGIDGVLFGLVLSVALSMLCSAIHIAKLRSDTQSERLAFEESEKKRGPLAAILLILAVAVLFALSFVIKNGTKALVCSAVIFVLVIFSVIYVPTFSKAIARGVSRLLEKRYLGKEALVFRAIENNYSLRHVGMIVTVSLTLMLSISLCQSAASEMLSLISGGVKYENVVLNSDPSIAAHIKENYSADGICELRAYSDAILDGKHVVFAVSAYGDTDKLLNDAIAHEFPRGQKIVISRAIAKLCGVKLGDTVSFSVDGNEYFLEVANIVHNKALVVFFDAKALGIRPDMCAFDLTDTVSQASLREYLELNGASLTASDSIFARANKTGQAFILIIRNALYASVFLTLIGVINSVLSSYRRRRHEFDLLSLCGMSRREKAARTIAELVCTVVISLLLALPLIAVSFTALEIGASSFGLTIF